MKDATPGSEMRTPLLSGMSVSILLSVPLALSAPGALSRAPEAAGAQGGLCWQLTNTELGKSAAFIAGRKQACSLSRGDMLPYLSRFSAAPVTLRNGLGMARVLLYRNARDPRRRSVLTVP